MKAKTLAVIGGTGRVGQLVIKQALERGYNLRVLARTPSKVQPDDRITVIKGDARDGESLNQLLQGSDAVVSTLGPAGMNESLKAAKESAKLMPCYSSTKQLLPLMKKHNVRRFVLTGGASFTLPGDKNRFHIRLMFNRIAPLFLGDIYIDREKEYELLRDSDIDWTIARCGKMSDVAPTSPLKMNSQTFQGVEISTHHIAGFLLDQVEEQRLSRKALYLAN